MTDNQRSLGSLLPAISLTTVAMLAFAGNSILCRMALYDAAIDAASFTNIRMLSGALTLLVILAMKSTLRKTTSCGSWFSALMLLIYAVCFSYAYIDLGAGTGALILFGLVQGTMIVSALLAGDRPSLIETLGWISAAAGMVYLVLPGAEAPSLSGTVLMAVAGIAWGVYCIRGQAESDALASTASNFARSLVLVPLLFVFTMSSINMTVRGAVLAVASGAITSGIGYVIWYAALTHLKTLQAAMVQLSVPAIAALGGVVLLGEALSLRLIIAAGLILGGISIALSSKSESQSP